MSRDDGFPIADLDVGFLRDVKVRRLRAQFPDDAAAATLLYLALVLSSWEEGARLAIEEADSPASATPERIAALRAVDLIDAEGRILERAWEGWFRPAWERREKKRAGGRAGNEKRWGTTSDSASHSDSQHASVSDAVTDSEPESPSIRPSVPTDPSAHTTRESEPDPLDALQETFARRGARIDDRTNGHARIVRDLVAAHGLEKVRATLEGLPEIKPGTFRQLVLSAENVLNPPASGSVHVAGRPERSPTRYDELLERDLPARPASRRVDPAVLRGKHYQLLHEAAADPDCPECAVRPPAPESVAWIASETS